MCCHTHCIHVHSLIACIDTCDTYDILILPMYETVEPHLYVPGHMPHIYIYICNRRRLIRRGRPNVAAGALAAGSVTVCFVKDIQATRYSEFVLSV